MSDLKYSYAAAETFPLKVVLHPKIITAARELHRVLPIHIQLNPTNKCPFHCGFCSCSNRAKNLELSFDRIARAMKQARTLGCESVTITGGGEPLFHKNINRVIRNVANLGIQIGIVTNGLLLDRLKEDVLARVTWMRISCSDRLKQELKTVNSDLEKWIENIRARTFNGVDYNFSYVVTDSDPDLELIKHLVEFAEDNLFTHVRIVNDILNVEKLSGTMDKIHNYLQRCGISEKLVNYQSRSVWDHGQKKCWISLLKPVIGADGFLYPCCGTQYALKNPSKDYEFSMRMGKMELLNDLIVEQAYFDGSACVKCYYAKYNDVLEFMLTGLKHERFV